MLMQIETSTGHKPVRVLDLQPEEWTTVIHNLNITTGCRPLNLENLAKSAVVELETPSNKEGNWHDLFQKSQVCIPKNRDLFLLFSNSRFVLFSRNQWNTAQVYCLKMNLFLAQS